MSATSVCWNCLGSGGAESDNPTALAYIFCKQGGTRSRFDADDSGPLQLVGGTPDHPQVQAYTWAFAHLGRFTVQGWLYSSHGMVNPSQGAGVDMATVGEVASRPLYHWAQPQVVNLLLTSSGHGGMGS